jgi:hypothetical protein
LPQRVSGLAEEMNLFLECFRQFSSLEFDNLVGRIELDMPKHFLLSTLHLQPCLQKYQHQVEDITAFLSARNSKLKIWRNPEVYGQIALLAKVAASNDDLSATLESLRLQVGMVQPWAARLANGVYRLAHVNGSFYVVNSGEIREIRHEILTSVNGFRGLVFLPFENLFSDLVDPSLYLPTCNDFNRGHLESKLAKAFELLECYSPELMSDLQEVVRTIVLVPDLGDAKRWSYNLRLSYFGGIFINPFVVGVYGLVEALIHEYCHQRLWQWWTYEPPTGLPPEDMMIQSPVTGRNKSAMVMVHAFVIYVSVYNFYVTQVLPSGDVSMEEERWVVDRICLLSKTIPELYRALCSQLQSGTVITSILDYAMERFKLIGCEGVAL